MSLSPSDNELLESHGLKVLKLLSIGAFANFYVAKHESSKSIVGLKVFPTKNISEAEKISITEEITILKDCRHPYIVKIYDAYQSSTSIILVMEYSENGNLANYLKNHPNPPYIIKFTFFHQILMSLKYLHNKGIFHGDVKLENITLDKQGKVKIIDFNLSVYQKRNPCDIGGTPLTLAPERINKQALTSKSDIWSAGVLFFFIVFGYYPFDGANVEELYDKILDDEPNWPEDIDPTLKDLLSKMLTKDPEPRATIEEVLSHEWMERSFQLENLRSNIVKKRKFTKGRIMHANSDLARYAESVSFNDIIKRPKPRITSRASTVLKPYEKRY